MVCAVTALVQYDVSIQGMRPWPVCHIATIQNCLAALSGARRNHSRGIILEAPSWLEGSGVLCVSRAQLRSIFHVENRLMITERSAHHSRKHFRQQAIGLAFFFVRVWLPALR